MRIGFDTHSVSRGYATGNRTYTVELIRALVTIDQHNDYVLYAADKNPFYDQFLGNPRVQVRYIASPNGLIRNFISLPIAFAQDSLDIVHLHILPRYVRVPCLLAVHDLYFSHLSSPTLSERVINQLVLRSLPKANHVVTLSEYSKNDIVRLSKIDPRRISVIPLGVNKLFMPLNNSSEVDNLLNDLGIRRGYILFVGRTEDPRKNLQTLIDAYAILKLNNEITAQLVIIGRHGKGTEVIKQKIESLNLESDVIMPGIVSEKNLPTFLSQASVFVYASSFEGFGLPVLEAMACGTPVITSNATSLPEVAGDVAIMVTPGKILELVQAIRRVLSDTKISQQMRESGLKWASNFSWERTARETLSIYEQIQISKE